MAGVGRALALLLALTAPLTAQAPGRLPPIDTDRPDFTDGTGTVALRHVQLESGLTRTAQRDHSSTVTAPELLVRYGLLGAAEVRLSATFESLAAAGGSGSTGGIGDLNIGTKFHLAAQRGPMPALSGEAFVTLPTGAAAVSAGRALPGAALLLGWSADGPWSAGVEFQVARGADAGAQGIASLSVQLQATSRLQPYLEYYTVQALGQASGAQAEHYANTGILLLLSNDVQVDGRVGVGLNHAADRSFIGLGFAIRR